MSKIDFNKQTFSNEENKEIVNHRINAYIDQSKKQGNYLTKFNDGIYVISYRDLIINNNNATAVEKNSNSSLPNGANPSIPLASRICKFIYNYELNILGNKEVSDKEYGTKNIPVVLDDFVTTLTPAEYLSIPNVQDSVFLQELVIPVRNQNLMYSSYREFDKGFSDNNGIQTPEGAIVDNGNNIRYIPQKYHNYKMSFQQNTFENARLKYILGIDEAADRFNQFKSQFKDSNSETQIRAALNGSIRNTDIKGLFRNDSIKALNSSAVAAMGFSGTNNSLSKIVLGSDLETINEKLIPTLRQMINGKSDFVPEWFKTTPMKDPVLVVPISDYYKMDVQPTTNFGGENQYRMSARMQLERQLRCKIIPSPFTDCSQIDDFSVTSNNINKYYLYDRSKMLRFLTDVFEIGAMSTDYKTTLYNQFCTSFTDVVSLETISGFKFDVAQ